MEFFNAIKSVMAAFVGVQKKKNLDNDFQKKNATPFIVAGVLMAIVFVVSIYTVVQLILP